MFGPPRIRRGRRSAAALVIGLACVAAPAVAQAGPVLLGTTTPFVVLAGSTGRKESVTSILGTSDHQMRLKLIDAGILKIEGDTILVTKDHLFRSPSTAAVALLGRTANGWKEWKSPEGKTLDTLKRQAPQG